MQDKITDKKENNFLKLSKIIFDGFFYGFVYLSTFFSLLMVTYLLALQKLTGLALIGLFILKGFLFFYFCILIVIITEIVINANIKSKLRLQERRNKLKEELKLEILYETNKRIY